MKYILKNLKYLVFTLTFVIVGFAFSNSTHASTYSYSCSDGGTITSTVDISPTGPFSAGNTTPFHVSASMQSFSCGTREVNLTAQNNSGVTHTIIPNQTLNQNGFIPPVIDSTNFAAPSSQGAYAVHFITGVDEPTQAEHIFTGADLVSASVNGPSNIKPDPVYLNGPGTIYFTADPGTYYLSVGVDMNDSGSIQVVDSDFTFHCANTTGADESKLDGVVFDDLNPVTIQIIKTTQCPQ